MSEHHYEIDIGMSSTGYFRLNVVLTQGCPNGFNDDFEFKNWIEEIIIPGLSIEFPRVFSISPNDAMEWLVKELNERRGITAWIDRCPLNIQVGDML